MHIQEKLMLDRAGLLQHGPCNIVIFGDSISHGAFNGYVDQQSVYWNLLKQKLHAVRDYMPINMICAAVGGATAGELLPGLEERVLSHKPDLVIVCFGLNDINGTLEDFTGALQQIFQKCLAAGCDVVFMTPNMLNTYVAEDTPVQHKPYAEKTAQMQNSGRMDQYIYAAVELAERMGVPVCDCYSKWKELSKTQDTTLLLSNRVNHPIEEMHNLFADALFDWIMQEK